MKFNKRWALFAALLLAGMLLAACGGTNAVQTIVVTEFVEGKPVEVVKEVTVAPEGPAPKDTLIICMSQEPDSLYSVTSNMAVTSLVLMSANMKGWIIDRGFFYEAPSLADQDGDGVGDFPSFENGDAVIEGEGSDAVLSVTYRFRDDITWSDGEPFTVDDILFTREIVIDPESGAVTKGILDQQTFEKIDDYTLKVIYPAGVKNPLYFLPPLSSTENGSIAGPLPEHVLGEMTAAEIKESEYARLPNPTLGAYKFVEWVEGDNIRLERVDGWWGGEAEIPNLVFRVITDTNQLMASVLSGECDFATNDGLQLTQLPFIQQSADKGLIAYNAEPALVWEHIDFNTAPPPEAEADALPFFADKRVRQAVAYGTNRLEMTEQILYGEVEPLSSYLPRDHWAYNPELDDLYPYDPDQARALLADAGWADSDGDGFVEAAENLSGEYSCNRGSWDIPAGTPFEVSFHTTTGNSMREQLSTLFQANMSDIGLNVGLDLLPASVWFADDGPLFTRTYQIGEFAWVTTPDPTATFTYQGSNVYKTPTGEFLAAENALAADPDLLSNLEAIVAADAELQALVNDGYGSVYEWFMRGRATIDQLPEGYELSGNEQIPHAEDDYEGGNNLSWCNTDADQLLFDGDNVIAPEDRLPHFLAFQLIFAEEVPSLPLFQRVNVDAFGVNLCGVDLGPANTQTWNVETWYFGECE